jgi:hypothetical protein
MSIIAGRASQTLAAARGTPVARPRAAQVRSSSGGRG